MGPQPGKRLGAGRLVRDPGFTTMTIVAIGKDRAQVGIMILVIIANENLHKMWAVAFIPARFHDLEGKAIPGLGIAKSQSRFSSGD
jgi:hypothetical protein